MSKPNVLFIMTDQQRFDTIAALGNDRIYTPNYDRLVQRGICFDNAYSTCPVCVPARYTIRTGREPGATCYFHNPASPVPEVLPRGMEERCGPYLARTMAGLGYRTFGIGKFHSQPWDEDLGYEVHLHTEETFGVGERRLRDAYAGWIAREHPEYSFIEMLHGERTEMYYMPQMSPLPAECTVKAFPPERGVEQFAVDNTRPFFVFFSSAAPPPPLAPPIPYNRLYDPDRMPNPVRGPLEQDHMDDQIPCMNYHIWAEDISDAQARVLRARYYGEITYIDACLGRILDAVEARGDADNTLICFFADHGDHMGDHHAWQKESFFEQSCRVPFLLSWPSRFGGGARRGDLVCLTDLFGIATNAAGKPDLRDGVDVLGVLDGTGEPRQYLVGMHGEPGTPRFKVMVRAGDWKYIYLANGGRELLFNVTEDPDELQQRLGESPDVAGKLRAEAIARLASPATAAALEDGDLKKFDFREFDRKRVYQYNRTYGWRGFPEHPRDLLAAHFGTATPQHQAPGGRS